LKVIAPPDFPAARVPDAALHALENKKTTGKLLSFA
jgi:hypothetical protein